MFVLEGLVGLQRTVQLNSALLALAVGHKLGFLVVLSGFPCKGSMIIVIFEIAPKYCILDSFFFFFYYEGYSISSKGFLPTVVDIMVI